MAAGPGQVDVRLHKPHAVYYEDDVNAGWVIHLTGFDDDGSIIRDDNGQVYTPIKTVDRTAGVSDAIREGRLIDVERTDGDREAVERAVVQHRARRADARDEQAAVNERVNQQYEDARKAAEKLRNQASVAASAPTQPTDDASKTDTSKKG